MTLEEAIAEIEKLTVERDKLSDKKPTVVFGQGKYLDEAVRILERHKMTEEYKRLEAEYKKGYADGYKQACEIINALQTEAFNRLFSGRDTGLLDGMPEQEKTNDRHR